MKKLLHERLRDASRAVQGAMVSDGVALSLAHQNDDSFTITLTNEMAEMLADEIERYYIPRPRFEDGEPVQFGDETFTLEQVDGMQFNSDGTFELHKKQEVGQGTIVCFYKQYESVFRPSPKVLDADGVEIKVGDTVWDTATGRRYEVTVLSDKQPFVFLFNGDHQFGPYASNRLTHKEPDSLEKLLEYLEGKYNLCSYELDEVRDRLSALIEKVDL